MWMSLPTAVISLQYSAEGRSDCSDPQISDIYGNNTTHCYSSATQLKNTTKSSAPEDGHKVARNMLSNL